MVPSVETSVEAQIAALMTLEKLTYDLNSKFYKFYSGLVSGSTQSEFFFSLSCCVDVLQHLQAGWVNGLI